MPTPTLPDEIVAMVLALVMHGQPERITRGSRSRIVRQGGPNVVAQLARVSRQWRAEAERLLYSNIILHGPRRVLLCFRTIAYGGRGVGKYVKSLNVHLHDFDSTFPSRRQRRIAMPFHPVAGSGDDGRLLAAFDRTVRGALDTMKQLTTYSLMIGHHHAMSDDMVHSTLENTYARPFLPLNAPFRLRDFFCSGLAVNGLLVRFLRDQKSISRLHAHGIGTNYLLRAPAVLPNLKHVTGSQAFVRRLVLDRPLTTVRCTQPVNEELVPQLVDRLKRSKTPVKHLSLPCAHLTSARDFIPLLANDVPTLETLILSDQIPSLVGSVPDPYTWYKDESFLHSLSKFKSLKELTVYAHPYISPRTAAILDGTDLDDPAMLVLNQLGLGPLGPGPVPPMDDVDMDIPDLEPVGAGGPVLPPATNANAAGQATNAGAQDEEMMPAPAEVGASTSPATSEPLESSTAHSTADASSTGASGSGSNSQAAPSTTASTSTATVPPLPTSVPAPPTTTAPPLPPPAPPAANPVLPFPGFQNIPGAANTFNFTFTIGGNPPGPAAGPPNAQAQGAQPAQNANGQQGNANAGGNANPNPGAGGNFTQVLLQHMQNLTNQIVQQILPPGANVGAGGGAAAGAGAGGAPAGVPAANANNFWGNAAANFWGPIQPPNINPWGGAPVPPTPRPIEDIDPDMIWDEDHMRPNGTFIDEEEGEDGEGDGWDVGIDFDVGAAGMGMGMGMGGAGGGLGGPGGAPMGLDFFFGAPIMVQAGGAGAPAAAANPAGPVPPPPAPAPAPPNPNANADANAVQNFQNNLGALLGPLFGGAMGPQPQPPPPLPAAAPAGPPPAPAPPPNPFAGFPFHLLGGMPGAPGAPGGGGPIVTQAQLIIHPGAGGAPIVLPLGGAGAGGAQNAAGLAPPPGPAPTVAPAGHAPPTATAPAAPTTTAAAVPPPDNAAAAPAEPTNPPAAAAHHTFPNHNFNPTLSAAQQIREREKQHRRRQEVFQRSQASNELAVLAAWRAYCPSLQRVTFEMDYGRYVVWKRKSGSEVWKPYYAPSGSNGGLSANAGRHGRVFGGWSDLLYNL